MTNTQICQQFYWNRNIRPREFGLLRAVNEFIDYSASRILFKGNGNAITALKG